MWGHELEIFCLAELWPCWGTAEVQKERQLLPATYSYSKTKQSVLRLCSATDVEHSISNHLIAREDGQAWLEGCLAPPAKGRLSEGAGQGLMSIQAGLYRKQSSACSWQQWGQLLPTADHPGRASWRSILSLSRDCMSTITKMWACPVLRHQAQQWGRNCFGLGSVPSPLFMLPWGKSPT